MRNISDICSYLCVSCGGTNSENEVELQVPTLANQVSRSNTLAPIRLHYKYLNFDLKIPELNVDFKNEIMLAVDSLFSSVLRVYPLEGNLMMTGITTCGPEITVLIEHQEIGVEDTDVIIYITTAYSYVKNYVSYAGACAHEGSSLGNIIAGRVVLNVDYFES